jgi:N-acetylglucosaminyl-diphospho-decaprenol L-rhamnosyltransferase
VSKLAVIVVSTNEAAWLRPCLETVFAHAGGIDLDVVVADNESTDGTAELVEREFPAARVVRCRNHGFGHANNRAIMTTDAPFVLFLNPDTEILEGTFADLIAGMKARPEVGLVGVKQMTADGKIHPTIRRFPSVGRSFAAIVGESLSHRVSWAGERELDMSAYERETECDWMSGSFLLVRGEALESGGLFDERFFVYAEEVDLCLRIKRAGWRVVHLPTMTILHHAGKAGFSERVASQEAFARRQYFAKNSSTIERRLCLAAFFIRYLLRAVSPGGADENANQRRRAARAALLTLVGRRPPPFGEPPRQAVALRAPTCATGESRDREGQQVTISQPRV